MPTYQYRCSACDNRFEAFQKFAENPLTDCPVCGGPVRRVIQPVGVVFKGSGWYINDSRKKSSESSESSPSPKSPEAKSTDTTVKTDSTPAKTESTPAAKTETKSASAVD